MKKYLLVIIAMALSSLGYAQDKMNYPQGIYMSLEEIENKTPSMDATLNWEKRTQVDIKMWGGNDYELTCDDKSIKKKTIKKEIFAYSDGEYMFINGFSVCIKDMLWSSRLASIWFSRRVFQVTVLNRKCN